MTDVVKLPAKAVQTPTKPRVPASLLACLADPDPDMQGAWQLPARLPAKPDLQGALASLDAHMQPASPQQVLGILALLQTMTRTREVGQTDWKVRGAEYARLLGHYPADIWRDAYDQWLRTPDAGRFFPTVSELGGIMGNLYGRRQIQIRRIREMLEAHDRPKPRTIKPAERAERLRGMIATYERLGMHGKAKEAREELAAAEREAATP